MIQSHGIANTIGEIKLTEAEIFQVSLPQEKKNTSCFTPYRRYTKEVFLKAKQTKGPVKPQGFYVKRGMS